MRNIFLAVLFTVATVVSGQEKAVMVVHGGAGTITRASLTPETEKEYRAGLEEALRTGHATLKRGGSSVDAVEAAIRVLEDNPLFNAGKGAVFTHEGRNELDASIMEGKTKMAGAVAALTIVRNPISAARAAVTRSDVSMSSRARDGPTARVRSQEKP